MKQIQKSNPKCKECGKYLEKGGYPLIPQIGIESWICSKCGARYEEDLRGKKD